MKEVTLETLVSTIEATDRMSISMPVEDQLSELRQFYKIMETEKDRFIARGLTPEFCSIGYALSEVLDKAESDWVADRFDTPEVVKLWKERAVGGYTLRNNLLQDLELALMGLEEAEYSLEVIRKGDDEEDMLFDISKLVNLCKKYPAEVAAGGITEEVIADATMQGQQLTSLFSSAEIAADATRARKRFRDQAKTFAHNYLSLIRKYADAIYRDEPEKRALFVSKYRREHNNASRKNSDDVPVETSENTVAE